MTRSSLRGLVAGRELLWIHRPPLTAWPSVKITPMQFEQDGVFTAVVDALKHAGFPPDLLGPRKHRDAPPARRSRDRAGPLKSFA
ncbi:MAG: hypothetical protein ABGW98_19125, partial [Myxococcales bacterium]